MKKEVVDVNKLRESTTIMGELRNVDDGYTFYYDETNNMRALKIIKNGLNKFN